MSSSEQIKLGSGAYGPSGVQGQSPWPSCNKKKGGPCGPPFLVVLGWISNLEIHVAHAAARGTAGGALLLRLFGDHRFRGDQQRRDRGRVLQGRAHDLGRVDDASGHQVLVLAVLGVEAEIVAVVLQNLSGDNRTVL